jgi:hypothetical protein
VGVVGGVEEVLMVELAKDERLEDVAGGDGGVRVVSLDGLEAGEGAVVVEVVEVLVGFADLGGEVNGVGVGGMVGVREGWECQQECKKKEAEDFYAAFYCSSPKPELIGVIESISLLMRMIVSDAADLILDAVPGKLYPLVPGNPRVPLNFHLD